MKTKNSRLTVREIRDIFATVPLDFVRKNIQFVTFALQKCVQDAGPYSETYNLILVYGKEL
jgi:hypothetical protein